jgi:hypothetical protein
MVGKKEGGTRFEDDKKDKRQEKPRHEKYPSNLL